MGDATNYVIILGGELLVKAESLLRVGVHPSEIIQGYQAALREILKILPGILIRLRFLILRIER